MSDASRGSASGSDGGPDRNPAGMMADVLAGISRLVQGELALARAEAAERLRLVQHAALFGVVAVVLGITAVNALAAAAVAGVVGLGLAPPWASLLVGAGLLALAFGFARHTARLMQDASSLPRRSGASVKRDIETLQTLVRRDGQD